MRILFTGSGRRVNLLRYFRESAGRQGIDLEIHVTDTNGFTAAWQVADHTYQVHAAREPEFLDEVERIDVDAVVSSDVSCLMQIDGRLTSSRITTI